ncbi:MAG: septum formation protein Maf [Clostridia bacterium]|nr:septum formation protein Maf [Clostridia bacterium]
MKIYLASKSPRRREILNNMGIDPVIIVSDADENIDSPDPEKTVTELALRKVRAVADKIPEDALAIAADTVVYADGEILGKPKDDEDARRMLEKLSGRRHSVYTGVALTYCGMTVSGCEKTEVCFRKLSESEIREYVDSGEPRDKAGAYAIQGRAAFFVSRIVGDYLNVIGLPVCLCAGLAAGEFGIDLFSAEHRTNND